MNAHGRYCIFRHKAKSSLAGQRHHRSSVVEPSSNILPNMCHDQAGDNVRLGRRASRIRGKRCRADPSNRQVRVREPTLHTRFDRPLTSVGPDSVVPSAWMQSPCSVHPRRSLARKLTGRSTHYLAQPACRLTCPMGLIFLGYPKVLSSHTVQCSPSRKSLIEPTPPPAAACSRPALAADSCSLALAPLAPRIHISQGPICRM